VSIKLTQIVAKFRPVQDLVRHYIILSSFATDYILEIVQTAKDTQTITPDVTSSFLEELQLQLARMGLSVDTSPFADDPGMLIDLLRVTYSTELLGLLRQYSTSGSFDLNTVDQQALQQEVQQTLQPATLNLYYKYTSIRDVSEMEEKARVSVPVSWFLAGNQSSSGLRLETWHYALLDAKEALCSTRCERGRATIAYQNIRYYSIQSSPCLSFAK
jgi:hypothetical protein